MPYKSDAQRRFFHAAENRGEISHKVVKEFDKASKGEDMPEYVKKSDGGMIRCYACGGVMMAAGGEAEDPEEKDFQPLPDMDSDEDDEKYLREPQHMFVLALRGRK